MHILPEGVLDLGEKYPRSGMQGGDNPHAVPYPSLSQKSFDFVSEIKKLHFLDGMESYRFGFDQHCNSPSPLTASLRFCSVAL
jgi:hypothetical protein